MLLRLLKCGHFSIVLCVLVLSKRTQCSCALSCVFGDSQQYRFKFFFCMLLCLNGLIALEWMIAQSYNVKDDEKNGCYINCIKYF